VIRACGSTGALLAQLPMLHIVGFSSICSGSDLLQFFQI